MTQTEQAERIANDHAERCGTMLAELRMLLGDDFYAGKGGLIFQLTGRGRSVLRVADTIYFRDEESGSLYAGRTRGGRAEFARVPFLETGDSWVWAVVSLGDASAN